MGDPQSLIAADFNGDGAIDLAGPNRPLVNVSVLLGLGDGTFSAAQYFAVGRNPNSVVSGDFNGDGMADLATSNSAPDNVTVLLNQGATLVLGDLNGDAMVNLLDVQPFVDLLTSGGFQAEADINQDGVVNLLDVQLFVNLLSGHDDVLFDNGLTLCDGLFFQNSHTGETSQYQVADDFQLGAGTWIIDRIKWTGNLVEPPQPFFQPEVTVGEVIDFDILIFADDAGVPTGQPIDPVPGTAIAHRFAEGITGSSAGLFMPPFLEVEIAQFEASFDPIILAGQTTYWIVIAANGEQFTYVAGEDGLTWAWRGQTEIGNACLGGTNLHDNWFLQGVHQDLTLFGRSMLPGDVNLDGVADLLDVQPFVDLLTSGGYQAEADINQDGVVNLLDVGPFVALLSGG